MCKGESGFPAVVTISAGLGSAAGVARRTYSDVQGEEKEKRKLVHILVHTSIKNSGNPSHLAEGRNLHGRRMNTA
jgi:hypothetical protein